MADSKKKVTKAAAGIKAVVAKGAKSTEEETTFNRDIELDMQAEGLMDNLMSDFIQRGGIKKRK